MGRKRRNFIEFNKNILKYKSITPQSAADYLGVSRMAVISCIKNGLLKATLIPHGYSKITGKEFRKFLNTYGIPNKQFDKGDFIKVTQITKLFGVARSTVIKWIDKGLLRVLYKFPTGMNRILKNDFIAFLKEHDIPLKILEGHELFSANQVAEICKLSLSTIVNRINTGKFKPSFQLPGGAYKFIREDLISIMKGKGIPSKHLK